MHPDIKARYLNDNDSQGEFIAHPNVDSITMAVDPENHLLVTADTSGEMKTWLIEGFCDGSVLDEEAEPLLKPGKFLPELRRQLRHLYLVSYNHTLGCFSTCKNDLISSAPYGFKIFQSHYSEEFTEVHC